MERNESLSRTIRPSPIGVLLMTFGSAATPEDVPAYMASVRGGRPAPDDLVEEFQRRYRLIGGSPLVAITKAQGSALETLLNGEAGEGERFVVRTGMRHSAPFIADGLRELADLGCRRLLAIVMSPQYSPIIMGGYNRAVEVARDGLPAGTVVTVSGAWHREPAWIETLATRVKEAVAEIPDADRPSTAVIFTAHSLPKSVVDREPFYIDQLMETVRDVAAQSELDGRRLLFAYQSAGHTPEEWLKPDLKDVLPGLQQEGYRRVLIAPVQFLADHLEILYDLDVAARQEAESEGIQFSRIEMPNTSSPFIQTLAGVVKRELAASQAGSLP